MSDDKNAPQTEMVGDEEVEEVCNEQHLADLDATTNAVLTTFSTIRSKTDDLVRAESDIKRFELSIEQERKRLQKTFEAAKVALRNARVQMGVELAKIDAAGFAKVSQMIKDDNNA
jgi:hypothetical protein